MKEDTEPTSRKEQSVKTIRLPMTLAFTLLVAAGCVPSLNPLYTEKDLVFEPALVGVWTENDEAKDTWAFEKQGENGYRLIYTNDGKTGEFEARLLKLGGTLFLDFYPDEAGLKDLTRNDFYKSHLVPAHSFAKVMQIEPTLQMALLDPDWVKKLLEKNPGAIAHGQVAEDRIVLTAPTKELQKFVVQYAKEAFGEGEPSNLKRIKSKP